MINIESLLTGLGGAGLGALAGGNKGMALGGLLGLQMGKDEDEMDYLKLLQGPLGHKLMGTKPGGLGGLFGRVAL